MTIEIPADIPQWAVVAAAGEKFPRMDEVGMDAVHTLLVEAVQRSERAVSDFDRLLYQLERCGESQAVSAAVRSGREIRQVWGALATGLGSLAAHVEQARDDGVFTKVVIITALSQLVAQVWMAVLFPPGAVAADVEAYGAARLAVREAIEWLVARLGGRGVKLVVLAGAAQGAVPNLVAQLYQMSKGDREGIDLASLGTNMVAGGVGGLAGHGLAKGLMPALNRVEQRYVANLPKAWLQKAARGGEVLTVMGAAGAAGGVAGSVAASVVSGQGLSLAHVLSAAGGGMSGSVIGGAVHALRPAHSPAGTETGARLGGSDDFSTNPQIERAWKNAVQAQRAALDRPATVASEPVAAALTDAAQSTAGSDPALRSTATAAAASEHPPVAQAGAQARPNTGGGSSSDPHELSQNDSLEGARDHNTGRDRIPPVSVPRTDNVTPRVGRTGTGASVAQPHPDVPATTTHAAASASTRVWAPATHPGSSTLASDAMPAAAQQTKSGAPVVAGAITGDRAPANPHQSSTISGSPESRAASSETVPGGVEPADGTRLQPQDAADGGAAPDRDAQLRGVDHVFGDRDLDVEGPNGRQATPAEERLNSAAEEILSDYHARCGELVPETMRLDDMSEEVLRFGLLHGNEHDSLLAAIETVRRHTGKLLYREQLMGVLAMRDGLIPEMAPGSGKTLTAAVHNVWTAIHRGPTLLVTSSDPLAYEAFAENTAIFGESGVKFLRIDPDRPVPAPQPGEPTVYIATQDALGFAELRGHLDEISFTTATIDEIDAALFYMNPTYVISDGAVHPASTPTAQAIAAARDFVDHAFASKSLTEADFGRNPALPRSAARLTGEGVTKAQRLWKGRMTEDDVRRINAAAAVALGDFVEGDHFLMHDGRPVIIDQFSHKVMRDPRTATESRWHDIAPAIEAAMAKKYDAAGLEHTITIHGNSETSKSTTLREVLQRRVQSLTGTSGTVMNVADTISTVYGTGEAVAIPRTKQHRLQYSDALFLHDQHEKQAALIGNVLHTLHTDNLPQLVLTHRNSDVARIAAALQGHLPPESIRAVDAKWILDQGIHWEQRLHEIVDTAGEAGKITIINMQGARGNDYKVHDDVADAGGMVAHLYGYSPVSRDVDAQAENRVARNGQRGRVYHYSASDDALFNHPNAQLVITHYRDTATAYHNDPSDHHRTALDHAGNQMHGLVSALQQQSLERLKTQFLQLNTTALINPQGPIDTTGPAATTPGNTRTPIAPAPEPATTNSHHQTPQPDMLPGHSDSEHPPRHTTHDTTTIPAPEHTSAADPDIAALPRQPPPTTHQLLAQVLHDMAHLNLTALQPSPVWDSIPEHPETVGGHQSRAPATADPTDPAQALTTLDPPETQSHHQPPPDQHAQSAVALPPTTEPSPHGHATPEHVADHSSETGLQNPVEQIDPLTGTTPWSPATGHSKRRSQGSTSRSRPAPTRSPTRWARRTAPLTTPWSKRPAGVPAVSRHDTSVFDVPGLMRRQEVEMALWQAEQAPDDAAEVSKLRSAAKVLDRAAAPQLARLLDAAAAGEVSPPIRSDTPALDDTACAMVTALQLRDLQTTLGNKRVTGIPRVRPGETHVDPSAWSWVLGGHGEPLPGGGQAGHQQVEKFLFGLHEDEPGPAGATQRANHHGRSAVVMDKLGPDSAHTYLVVNWRGTPLVVDPYRYERPVRFDPRNAGSVQAVSVVKLEADGAPISPIVTELTDELPEAGRRGTTVDAQDQPEDVFTRRDWMPAVAGIDKHAHVPTFDELWQRHFGAVLAEAARSYTDTALVYALVYEVRELARKRMPLRDHSSDPAAWLTGLAMEVASNPVDWAGRARHGLLSALDKAERAVLEPHLADANAAVLARVVDGMSPGRRQVVDLLSRQPESLRQKGFDDEVVLDTVRAVVGAIANAEMISPSAAVTTPERAFSFSDQTLEEQQVLQRLRLGKPIPESERPALASALAKVRGSVRGNAALRRRAEAYLLDPGERVLAGDPATVSVPRDWLPTWFSESGSTRMVPGPPAVAVVSALRSAIDGLPQDQADYLRMRLAGLASREVLAIMGFTAAQASEFHHVVMSKVATPFVRAALTSDPDLIIRGGQLLAPECWPLVKQIFSGQREVPEAELERWWDRKPRVGNDVNMVLDLLGTACLAEWAPVVAVAEGVGPDTTTALRTLASLLNPRQVKLLRLMLWLPDKHLRGYGSAHELVDEVFAPEQQRALSYVMRDEYRRGIGFGGPELMAIPRVVALGGPPGKGYSPVFRRTGIEGPKQVPRPAIEGPEFIRVWRFHNGTPEAQQPALFRADPEEFKRQVQRMQNDPEYAISRVAQHMWDSSAGPSPFVSVSHALAD
ncbi:hypothetical protein ACWEO7_35930, partial [Nocardia sp. NPDC004260]